MALDGCNIHSNICFVSLDDDGAENLAGELMALDGCNIHSNICFVSLDDDDAL